MAVEDGQEAAPEGLVRFLPASMVLVVAALLRLHNLGLAEFKYDEAFVCVRAREIALHGARPVVGGATSLGLPTPAGYLYFQALTSLFSLDPRAQAAAIAISNVLAVLACYFLAKRAFGDKVALVAGFLYAVNPWAVLDARKTWMHILPLFTVLAFYFLWGMIAQKKRRYAVPFFLLLALQGQMHPQAVFLVPGVALSLLIFWRRLSWRYVLLGAILGLGISWPYLRHILGQSHTLRQALGGTAPGGLLAQAGEVLQFAFWQASGYGVQSLLPDGAALLGPWMGLLTMYLVLVVVLALVGVAVACRRALSPLPGREAYALLLLWVIPPLVGMAFWPRPIYWQYLSTLYSFGYILVALPLGAILQSHRRPLIGLATLVFLLVVGGMVGTFLRLAGLLELHGWKGSFGLPLSYWQEAAAQAEKLDGEILVASRGDNPHYSGIPAIFTCLLEPERYPRYLDWDETRRVLVSPPKGGTLVVPPQVGYLYGDEMETQTQEIGAIVPEGAEDSAGKTRFFRLSSSEGWGFLPSGAVRNEAHFANGITLAGYRLPAASRPGEVLEWELYLGFGPRPPDLERRHYVFYNHLLDTEGQRRAQVDGFGWSGRFWREGEAAVAYFRMELPKDLPRGEYILRMGIYDLNSGERSAILDDRGQAMADGLEIGRILVR